jgi:hypothetical protein
MAQNARDHFRMHHTLGVLPSSSTLSPVSLKFHSISPTSLSQLQHRALLRLTTMLVEAMVTTNLKFEIQVRVELTLEQLSIVSVL